MEEKVKETMDKAKYEIFIGGESNGKMLISTQDLTESIIVGIYEKYSIAFSLSRISGGYLSDSGAFISEKSLCLTCITDVGFEVLNDALSFLKKFFEQEKLLIVKTILSEFKYE